MRRTAPTSFAALAVAFLLLSSAAAAPQGQQPMDSRGSNPVTLDGFSDGARHFREANDDDSYSRYDSSQVSEIAANILLYQRDNGGWRENWDPTRVLSAEEAARVASERSATDTTFDNRATYPQIEYLAEAHRQTGSPELLAAAVRGIEFILGAQFPNGGWPHSYPNLKGYRGHITVMDDVMPGILATLRKVASGEPPFDSLDQVLRDRAATAVARGDRCLLDMQVVVDGERTVWAGQYDRETLAPAPGRSFELVSLVSKESATVVRYLMSIDQTSPEIVEAIEAAVRWFQKTEIPGVRIEEFDADPVRYKYHTSTTDRRLVEDPDSPGLWARFYEIGTNRPFMANRDGTKVYSLAEVHRERRTGYQWYGDFGRKLLEREYPAWRERRGL